MKRFSVRVARRRRHPAHISMINLIDIVFVLLIFFMLTMSFKSFTKFNVNLPKSSISFDNTKDKHAEIFYLNENSFALKMQGNERTLELDELLSAISNMSEASKKSIKLSANDSINYGKVVELIVKLKKADVQKVELNIEKK